MDAKGIKLAEGLCFFRLIIDFNAQHAHGDFIESFHSIIGQELCAHARLATITSYQKAPLRR